MLSSLCCESQPDRQASRPVAVVISCEMFDRLRSNQDSLLDFMRRSPLYGLEDVKIQRTGSTDSNN
jgi:hypothetical protein